MDRDEFVRLMIAELSSQKDADPDGFMTTKPRSPLDIFRKMCFDYPDVTTVEMNLLGQAIENLCFEVKDGVSGKKTKEEEEAEHFRYAMNTTSSFIHSFILSFILSSHFSYFPSLTITLDVTLGPTSFFTQSLLKM